MAVASTSANDKTDPPCVESFPSSPLTSKPGSEHGGSDYSSALEVNSSHIDSSDQGYQSDSSRKDVDTQSPEYLKSEEYRLLFRLPPDETLVQDFNCAFQESILLQGHMYLFVRHICFYSNIFGFETKKTIHFNEVICVRKAKTAAIFPNAIEIVAGGKKYFFGSFLSRDEAYRLIVDGWTEYADGTKILIDHQELKSEIRREDSECVTIEKIKGSELESIDSHQSDRYKEHDISGECKLLHKEEDEVIVSNNPLETQENGKEDAEPVVNDNTLSCRESLSWKVEDADAPKVPVYFTKVAESKFPVQVEEFFNLFISDKAIEFIDTFHKVSGDKDFRCTSWSAHAQFGHTREVSFQHPIKIYFGAKFGNCLEVQKFRVYNNSQLVIETSQEISDVPYADYFRVEGLWVVERDGNETNNGCILRVYVNVAFSKRTMWKGKIEQSTIEECREAYSLWVNNAHELLKQKNLEKLDGELSASNMNPTDAQCQGLERDESSLKRLPSNVLQIPLVTSDTRHDNPALENSEHGGFSAASSSASLIRESLARFSLYLKNQNHLPLILVIASVLILLMQLSIIVLLSRGPQVNLISQMDEVYSTGSSRNDMVEAEAWLERRFHYLKDEMHMVQARLEKMQHEHASLKEHFKGLEQLRKSRR